MSETTMMIDDDDEFESVREADKDNPDLLTMVWERLKSIDERLIEFQETQEGIKQGVNVIGEMMNGVATVFDDLAQKVQQGGIGAMLGSLMGGKKNDG